MTIPRDPSIPSLTPLADNVVTCSNLVRHFGLWQARAARNPVYVLQHGRPKLVLLAIETLEALCVPGKEREAPAVDWAPVFDAVSDIVLLADGAGRILGSSRTARLHFGARAGVGQPITAIAASVPDKQFDDAIRRVIATGSESRFSLASGTRAARMLACTLLPAGDGVALVGADETAAQEHARLAATAAAASDAMVAVRNVALLIIDRHGLLQDPTEAAIALLGRPRDQLIGTQLSGMIATPRANVMDTAIARVLTGRHPETFDAELVRKRGETLAISVGLAPIWQGGLVQNVAALVRAR
ncbi:PAS domain-containing protein [Sphingomonas sp. CARO-RG-8B-R24-01]|uniref:PAS domain-containing protein n=1 Tax=Sphingomonas sp. CARO-RG-8B-R24-01 TaxID=2914831 RepID=UPI001F576069|nr:PAS domain-containing protein [Sphingomonas sp. CARO-RG-8B-R24-01]